MGESTTAEPESTPGEPRAARVEPRRVAVVGAGGRLGRYACELVEAAGDLVLVARVGRTTDLTSALRGAEAELALELTVAGRGAAHGRAMLEAGVRPVVGTSGVTLEETAELDALARARGLGGIVVPNFSLGAWLLQRLGVAAARELAELGWVTGAAPGGAPRSATRDVALEIVEEHHATKRDAPSGTALEVARLLAAALGPNAPAIPIHSLRLPGARANHEVVFGGPGELLRLRHETSGPECYGFGMLASLRWAATATGVARGLDAVLGAR